MPSTYTLQITFNGGKNLPVADIGTLSCDPYVLASIVIPDSDAEPLEFRTPTIHRTRDPTWNATWFVAGIPQTGFKLKMILYDEDPGVKLSNDRLGKAVARFGSEQMKEGFESIETEYVLKKRKGDLHPYVLTYLAALLPGEKLAKHNRVVVSMRVLRKDAEQKDACRMYTLGPNKFSRHFSPLIGSMVNKQPQKTAKKNGDGDGDANDADGQTDGRGGKLSATTFIANKLQFTGPVPPELRHRFVGYRPFIKWMFDDSGIRGRILYHGLRKQYRTIYACDKATVWGCIDDTGAEAEASDSKGEEGEDKGKGKEGPVLGDATTEGANVNSAAAPQGENKGKEGPVLGDATPESAAALARQFLDMTAWGEGAKLFTYVITLDGEWRFTETGPEFAVDLLSKHSMHANLAKEIAYSGEFFVHALPGSTATDDRDPKKYELIIDNDSGTYRPKKELLPVLEKWLKDERRLGGLGNVRAMDGFDEELKGLKEERADKKAELTGVGKKGKGKDGGKDGKDGGDETAGKLVPVPRGTSLGSVSSIGSGRVGRESVSSEEVEAAVKEMEDSREKEQEGKE
ncbi:hypothetical protein C8R46DRAFT_120714 [Mycena filopes]|nr:hypothetical protein C8R46DRAFT_120714 [Mycena filopes]